MSEIQTYSERLGELRQKVIKTLDGLSASGLNWKPTRQETNSLFILATHLLGSERYWLVQVVGGRMVERDRAAEFQAQGTTVDGLQKAFDEVARTGEEILSRLAPADLDAVRATTNYGPHTVRWCVLHVIEHYSEHFGQMSLTRQLWQAQVKSKNAGRGSKKPKAIKSARRRRARQ